MSDGHTLETKGTERDEHTISVIWVYCSHMFSTVVVGLCVKQRVKQKAFCKCLMLHFDAGKVCHVK